MAWTSRERATQALEHREADRVPIDVNPVLDFYLRLKEYLGLDIEEKLKPNSAMEVIPHPSVLAELGVDLISVKLGSPRGGRPSSPGNGTVRDGWGVIRRRVRQPGGGSYLEVVHHPLADATVDDLERYPWPDPFAPGRGEGAEAAAKRLHEDTDLALVGRFGGPIVEAALYLVGWEQWLVRLVKDPEFAAVLLDKIADVQIALDRVGLEATARLRRANTGM